MNYGIQLLLITALFIFSLLIVIKKEKKQEAKIAAGDYVIWHGHEFYVVERQDDWLIIAHGNMQIHKVKVTDVTLID